MTPSGERSTGEPSSSQSWRELAANWPLGQALATAKRTDLWRGSFPAQERFAKDPARLKVAFCTRRAAKSFSWGLEALDDSYDWPGANYLFLGLTRQEAKRIFWDEVLKALDTRCGLGMRFNEAELTARMPNGARIYLGGADANEDEMRKLLGQRYRKVCIDEAQSWCHADLEQLVFHTLRPATVDYQGSISLTGTAGTVAHGFFRDVTPTSIEAGKRGERGVRGEGWSLHCWDTTENTSVVAGRPMNERWAEELAELRAMKPGIDATPWFRRNYLGEWVVEDTLLCYRYAEGRNDYDVLPALHPDGWHHVLGCDLGWNATALAVVAYHDHDPSLYVRLALRKAGLDLTATAEHARALDREFRFERWMVDGAAKQSVEEMRRRQDIPWTPADKAGKADFIELLNTEALLGRVKVAPRATTADLREEWVKLVWDEKKLREKGVREEKAGLPNHCADATLYAWRECYPYLAQRPPVAPPTPGTPAWYEAERVRAEAEAGRVEAQWLEEAEQRQRQRMNDEEESAWM